MAISKVLQYNSTPTVVADYQAQNAHLQAMINKANGSMGILKQATIATIPSISQGAYISMGGTLYVVDTSDYTILGTAIAGLNYIRLGVSGDNLTATWVQDISSYTWNSVYNYYTNGTNALLPYVVNFDTNYYVSRFDQTINQQLKRDSDVEFNGITADTLHATNGIFLKEIAFSSGTMTQDALFQMFDDYVPNVGDIRLILGCVIVSSTSYTDDYLITSPILKRVSSTRITLSQGGFAIKKDFSGTTTGIEMTMNQGNVTSTYFLLSPARLYI